MKNLFTLCLLLGALSLFGQPTVTSVGMTTVEEYNYLTKGYKIQLDSGLDMKKGYSIQEVGKWGVQSSTNRTGQFFHLFRDGDSIPRATLVVFERPSTGFKEYLCIPHIVSSQEIWDRALKAFQNSQAVVSNHGYSWSMMVMISHLSSGAPPSISFE